MSGPDDELFDLEAASVLGTEAARALLDHARTAGAVSEDALVVALDELDLDPEQIDEVYRALGDLEVEVLDDIDEPQLASWMKQATAIPGFGKRG